MAALSPAVGCVPDAFLVSNIKLESQTTQAKLYMEQYENWKRMYTTNVMYQKYNKKLLERKKVAMHGAFIFKNHIHIQTGTHHMIYSIDTDLWENTQYADVGYHIQHVPHGDQALACKRRTDISKNEADDFIFSRYD